MSQSIKLDNDLYWDTSSIRGGQIFNFLKALSGNSSVSVTIPNGFRGIIYGFRGANIDNILNFQNVYKGSRLFKLEQNYRSTHSIVKAANSLIHKNERQIHKDVYSMGETGELVELTELTSDREEALFISKDIKERMRGGKASYSDFAILYRTNFQSRTFEEQFLKSAIPYRIYGGMSFYQRKEIKDIVAYFRLIVNNYDEEALARIINYPTRGIGTTTIQKVRDAAREYNISMWQVLEQLDSITLPLTRGAINKLQVFYRQIESFTEKLATDDAYALGKEIIRETGISKDIYSGTDPEQLSRQEHLEEFLASMQDFVETGREQDTPTTLTDFLQEVSLLSDRDDEADNAPKVTLMTIHSAKGLEFKHVFMAGMEDGLFPNGMTITSDDREEMEEERRLMYVGMTRAMDQLTLTAAAQRMVRGETVSYPVSRFVLEIPDECIAEGGAPKRKKVVADMPQTAGRGEDAPAPRPKPVARKAESGIARPYVLQAALDAKKVMADSASGSPSYGVGDRVRHSKYGEGTVLNIEPGPRDYQVTVDFDGAGQKIMYAGFAKLQKM